VWQLEKIEKDFISLQLPAAAVSPEWVDFPFELLAQIRIGEELENTLVMKNTGSSPVDISCALHTYFSVSDCEKIYIEGLEGIPFTVKGGPEQPGESAPLQIRGEICRLYLPQKNAVVISDPVRQRKITVTKENSASTLVWNPGAERCRQISDLMPEEFHDFVCVECNRAGTDTLHLLPGVEQRITQRIRIGEFS
jgi:glucose-6-phosphate 1-epimerase